MPKTAKPQRLSLCDVVGFLFQSTIFSAWGEQQTSPKCSWCKLLNDEELIGELKEYCQ